jgi:hypothetical protein
MILLVFWALHLSDLGFGITIAKNPSRIVCIWSQKLVHHNNNYYLYYNSLFIAIRSPYQMDRLLLIIFDGHGLFTYLLNWTVTYYAIFDVLRSALMYNSAVLATWHCAFPFTLTHSLLLKAPHPSPPDSQKHHYQCLSLGLVCTVMIFNCSVPQKSWGTWICKFVAATWRKRRTRTAPVQYTSIACIPCG